MTGNEGADFGRIDILIGTHRILSQDVRFHDLGLVIVDEEQRFGVAQKEKLKRLRTEGDVLSMSATPIPRTLNMALSGLRDISLIETPPRDRQAVANSRYGDCARRGSECWGTRNHGLH